MANTLEDGEYTVKEEKRNPMAMDEDDDDDDDDIVGARKRKRAALEEAFEFKLLAPTGMLDESSPVDVRSKFMQMFFETKLNPATEKELEIKVQEKRENRVGRTKRLTTAADRERQQRAADWAAKEIAELNAAMEDNEQVDNELTEAERVEVQRVQQQAVAQEAKAEAEDKELDDERDLTDAHKFFSGPDDENALIEAFEEKAAFKEISKVKKDKIGLSEVIPPEDIKRLYLRPADELIVNTDLPERYQLQLDSVGWTQQMILETFFGPNEDALMLMVNYIYVKLFRNTVHSPGIISRVLTYVFKYGNEPVFVQRYCMLRETAEDSCTLDDVWAIWNTAFEFMAIYNRREELKERLYPIHEAYVDGLFHSSQIGSTKYPTTTKTQRVQMAQRIAEGLESVSFDMYNVSFAELSTKGSQAKWTWEPHYLTWIEKWMTHWDEVFQRACTAMNTQIAYNMRLDGNKLTRIPLKRNEAVRFRSQNLFHFAMQFSAHPSTIALSLTTSGNEDLTSALTGRVRLEDIHSEDDRERVEGIQHMTLTKPSRPPKVMFQHWADVANQMHNGMWGTGPKAASTLREACCDMLAGSLSAEPRFRQTILNLIVGVDDQSIMSLGRVRVQPSTNGFGYFKQGGQSRVGYRNLCLNSRKFTSDLKEEIVKYVESGLMVFWFEVDDPAKVKREIENDLFNTEGMTENKSISASSAAPSTTMTAMTAMTQQLEVNRMNIKREALTSSVNISDLDIWYPSEQTFEQFKQKIKKRKTEIITSVLKDAHRDQGNINLSKLPFVPFDEWYTSKPDIPEDPTQMSEAQKIASEWAEIRTGIIEKAVYLALDDVEEILWDKISAEVKEKVLSDSAAGLRKIVLRSGYRSYKLKSGVLEGLDDANAKRMLLDEEMFNTNDATDYMLDTADTTPPGKYRIAGVVYDDVMKQHTICFLDEYGNYLDSFELQHLVMREEDPLVREKLDDMQVRLRKCIFTFRPQAWAIGMTHSTDLRVREMLRKFNVDWQAMLDDKDLRELLPPGFRPPKIELVDARISRVWARSREASTELRDLDDSRKKAVAIGRTLRNPLSAVASLFTADKDALSLALCEMQEVVPKLQLLRRLEQQMVSIVGVVGLDINHTLNQVARSEHGLLQFLPGFGPRKAAFLYRNIAGHVPTVYSRAALQEEPFNFPKTIFRNINGFVKIMLTNQDADRSTVGLFRHTLDRTRIMTSFYPIVTMMVHSIYVGLGKLDAQDLATLTQEEYTTALMKKVRKMMEDIEVKRRAGRLEDADLMQVDWQGMKDEWGRQYQTTAEFIEDDDEAAMVDSIPLPDLMQVIKEELIQPYGIRAGADDELNSMAEYRPTQEDTVFDTLVDDRSLLPGALRIVNVTGTTPNAVRLRIAGCDAVRATVLKSDTKPGSMYTEQDWALYRDQWFKKGMQFEGVITKIVKSSFLVVLTIDSDMVKEAKMKIDKHFKDMEKALRQKEKLIAMSQTASQAGTLDTVSQTGTQLTFPFTEDQTVVSTIDSIMDPRDQGMAQDRPQFNIPEMDGGQLLSHPLYIPSLETQSQARAKLVDVERATGRPYYKPGDLLMRPDVKTKARGNFKLDMRMHEHPLVDEKNVFGLGHGKELTRTAFLSIGFEVKGHSVVVKEHSSTSEKAKDEQNPDDGIRTFRYDDVDHMIHVYARQWYKQTLELRRHKYWDPRAVQHVRKWVAAEAVSRARTSGKSHHIPWKICPDEAVITDGTNGGAPSVRINALRFLMVFPGLTSQERKAKKTRMFMFEARRDHYKMIRACSSSVRFTGRSLKDLEECQKFAQHHYTRLAAAGMSARSRQRDASPALDGMQ